MSHSDVRLDFNFAMETSLEEGGISLKEIETLEGTAREVHRGLIAMKEVGQIPFYQLPYQEDAALKILEAAKQYKDQFDTLVVLGIGGSALGAKALLSSLKGPYFNYFPQDKREGFSRVFVCDNIDPDAFGSLLDLLDLKRTLFNVISKSGDSIETMSQFTFVKHLLQERVGADWCRHVVVTTDPVKGNLRAMVAEEKCASFEIPPGVGGRFSVLSPVGLFPAAMAGIDIMELLSGARRGDVRTAQGDLWLNPAYMLAALQFLMNRNRKNILVLMPYSEMMFPVAEWYCQLWAESIGKRFSLKGEVVQTGSTPVAACGVKDQHSQLQLYMEGPTDKFILFFILEHFGRDVPIPPETFNQGNLSYLGSHTMAQILQAEAIATEAALRDAGRPSSRILIPHRNPYNIGQLLFVLEVATAFAGGLFEVNPFDQPGVELGKKMTGGLLGRPGFENYKGLVEPKERNPQFVI
jgi:glucose-6-phosphate isomerase